MSVYERAKATTGRLLSRYGYEILVSRPDGTYDAETRRREAGAMSQTLVGLLLDKEPGSKKTAESLATTHTKIMIGFPTPVAGSAFDPAVGDIIEYDGKWAVAEAKIIKHQGNTILFKLGLGKA
jgi:hypothetical protein